MAAAPSFVRSKQSGFSDQIKAARLSFVDLDWLSNGVLSPAKLKNHSTGRRLLKTADYELLMSILESHREATKGIRLLVLSKQKAVPAPSKLPEGLRKYLEAKAASKVRAGQGAASS